MKKYFIDAALIIFSVLFALFINRLAEDNSLQKEKNIAKENVLEEIKSNYELFRSWAPMFFKVKSSLQDLVNGKNDSLYQRVVKDGFVNLDVLTNNQSLANGTISETAWEVTKDTGILKEFSFEEVKELTDIYETQKTVTDVTFGRIMTEWMNMKDKSIENADMVFLQNYYLFRELTAQGIYLEEKYKKFLIKEGRIPADQE